MTKQIVFAACMFIFARSQSRNTTSTNESIPMDTEVPLSYITDIFDLTSERDCAATIVQNYYPYRNDYQDTIHFQFINGVCNNPTLWYSYQPIYNEISSKTFFIIQNNNLQFNNSCTISNQCTSIDFCVANHKLNNSNNNITEVEFQIIRTNYESSNLCSNDQEFKAFITILCGDSNFTSQYTASETNWFFDDMIDNEIPQCGNKPNPYAAIPDISTTENLNADTDEEIESGPKCVIKASDNWQGWVYLGVAFIFVSISLFFCMTKKVGIVISVEKWGAILMLFLSSLAIASIFKALITTFVVMASYEKCNLLQSQAPLTPWDWQDDWEKNSMMGFWFWLIGVCISSAIYTVILMIKFNMRSVSQYQYGKVDCGEKFIGWCLKFLFFVITFSFSAVLRPFYFIGQHSELGTKCACVDGNIALIAEVYGAALISIILAPCAFKCGLHCVTGDDDDYDDDDKGNWLPQLIGCILLIYAAYCAFIVIASPFMFIAFRVLEYYASAENFFTSEDFTMFIWFFEGVSNFFTDLTN